MSRLALAIAAVPDVEAGRAIYNLGDLAANGVYKAMAHLHNQQRGTERLPLYQYRIVSASAVVESESGEVSLVSLSDVSEPELLKSLAELIDSASELVSWGGDDFDRPVLAYRYLKHGITCPAIFDQFSIDSIVHTTLSVELSGFHEARRLPLSELASVLGLPSEKGLEKINILECYQHGELTELSQACDADALNSFLISKRLELTKGELNNSEYQEDCDTLHTYLSESKQAHLSQFAKAWLPNNNK
jgi:predicted PolB exonuclease-like 3'-5' exonuclease